MNVYYPEVETSVQAKVSEVAERAEKFLIEHFLIEEAQLRAQAPLAGDFSLYSQQKESDLYGMADAVYTLYTIGKLADRTNITSRHAWANQILECQDERGWFSKRNLRGHSREHATAYAIGALKLLEIESGEQYVSQVRPLIDLRPILTDYDIFLNWIKHLQFRLTPKDILAKNVGWHYIWRGSHIGGGIAAIVGMTRPLLEEWWPGEVVVNRWFDWYFDWLDAQVSTRTGFWQRAFWNLVYRKPTLIDMGGAVHFLWIYAARQRRFPYPEKVIEATLLLQRETGLYKNHPFCIDLDGNFCVIRPFLQLSDERRDAYAERVYQSAIANFEGVVRELTIKPLADIYSDSHGLPGALAALVECKRLPVFPYTEFLTGWQNPLEKAWWL